MSPETQGQEQAFRPSIPDLTPNLDQNPTLDAKVEDSKEIYDMQVKGAEDARTRRDDLQRILDERAAGHGTDNRPQWELEGKLATEEDAVAHREKGRQEALHKAEQRYRENEEAIRNQAVIDAARAGIEVSQPGSSMPDLTPNLDEDKALRDKAELYKWRNDHHAEGEQKYKDTLEAVAQEEKAINEALNALSNLPNIDNYGQQGKEYVIKTLDFLRQHKQEIQTIPYYRTQNQLVSREIRANAQAESEAHFSQNEEAYKNQAINEARARGIDINYPGYTDQEPQSQ